MPSAFAPEPLAGELQSGDPGPDPRRLHEKYQQRARADRARAGLHSGCEPLAALLPLTLVRIAAVEDAPPPWTSMPSRSRRSPESIARCATWRRRRRRCCCSPVSVPVRTSPRSRIRNDPLVVRECERARVMTPSKPVSIDEGGVMPVTVDADARGDCRAGPQSPWFDEALVGYANRVLRWRVRGWRIHRTASDLSGHQFPADGGRM